MAFLRLDWPDVVCRLFNDDGEPVVFSGHGVRASRGNVSDGVYWLVSDDCLEVIIERLTVKGNDVDREEIERFAQGFDTTNEAFLQLVKREDIPQEVIDAIRLIPIS